MSELLEMKVLKVVVDPSGGFSVLLTDKEEKMILPIGIGPFEAQAIVLPLEGKTPPRPMTHDLLRSLCQSLDGVVEKVVIIDIRDAVFYAEIHLRHGDKPVIIDARPSDAIALAVRCEAPIYMATKLVEFTYKYEDLISQN